MSRFSDFHSTLTAVDWIGSASEFVDWVGLDSIMKACPNLILTPISSQKTDAGAIGWLKNFDDMLSRFETMSDCDGRTDRWMDGAVFYVPANTV